MRFLMPRRGISMCDLARNKINYYNRQSLYRALGRGTILSYSARRSTFRIPADLSRGL